MSWQVYEWKFRLKSPLHIGFHKILHFFKTRPYVPGKLLWGALTAKLTPILGINDYQKVGDFLKKTFRFGYLYPYVEGKLYIPQYTEEGLKFGDLNQNDFEKKFISSMASAAIEAESLTAEEGMLHEVEFISPYTIDDGKPVYLKGLFWLREFSEDGFTVSKKDKNVIITFNTPNIDFETQLVNRLQIGGEQKYGFGLLELKEFIKSDQNILKDFYGEWLDEGSEFKLKLKSNDPIWAHLLHTDSLNIKGHIEPLVGREWEDSKGSGRKLTFHGLFWTPGSLLSTDITLRIMEFGLWEVLQ